MWVGGGGGGEKYKKREREEGRVLAHRLQHGGGGRCVAVAAGWAVGCTIETN